MLATSILPRFLLSTRRRNFPWKRCSFKVGKGTRKRRIRSKRSFNSVPPCAWLNQQSNKYPNEFRAFFHISVVRCPSVNFTQFSVRSKTIWLSYGLNILSVYAIATFQVVLCRVIPAPTKMLSYVWAYFSRRKWSFKIIVYRKQFFWSLQILGKYDNRRMVACKKQFFVAGQGFF